MDRIPTLISKHALAHVHTTAYVSTMKLRGIGFVNTFYRDVLGPIVTFFINKGLNVPGQSRLRTVHYLPELSS